MWGIVEWVKIDGFRQITGSMSKTVQVDAHFLLKSNSKSYALYLNLSNSYLSINVTRINHAVCIHTHTHTHTGTRKAKTNLDFTEARDSEWQWHLLGHMQVCTSLQTDTTPAPHRSFFTGRMPFLPPNQQRQSTEGTAVCIHGWKSNYGL